MKYFAVVDTETTWSNEVMSIGLVIADANNIMPIHAKYYIVDPAYREGGMYSPVLFVHGNNNTYVYRRKECLDDIKDLLNEYNVKKIFAYNASFDKKYFPELTNYTWYDIMKIAAYKQYNKMIPSTVECYSTGKMKKGYSVEGILRMIGTDKSYRETHNAYLDALDELSIIRLLNLNLDVYDIAII